MLLFSFKVKERTVPWLRFPVFLSQFSEDLIVHVKIQTSNVLQQFQFIAILILFYSSFSELFRTIRDSQVPEWFTFDSWELEP